MKQNELFNKCVENCDPKTRDEVWREMDKELGRTELEQAAIDCFGKSGSMCSARIGFVEGAEWQKKQDELTWEDIKRIVKIADLMLTGTAWDAIWDAMEYPNEQKYYEEVLRRYKEEKK